MKYVVRLFLLLLLPVGAGYAQAPWRVDTAACIGQNPGLYSIVVAQGGKGIVYEQYFNGHHPEDCLLDHSLTKSVVSLLVGIAIGKGFIPSADEPISHYFPQLAKDADPRKQQITIRQVMNQASGLWHENLDSPNGLYDYLAQPDPSAYVLAQPLVSDPGKVFQYNNAGSHLLSVILTKATGMNTLAFAQQYLFGPLGITSVQWDKMKDGYYDGAGLGDVCMRSVDMLKIGKLILDEGIYQGKQIIPTAWIKVVRDPAETYHTPWGFQPSRYAAFYYHYALSDEVITYGQGWGGQYLVILPREDAVIVVNQDPGDRDAVKRAIGFTSRIFPILYAKLREIRESGVVDPPGTIAH